MTSIIILILLLAFIWVVAIEYIEYTMQDIYDDFWEYVKEKYRK